MNISLRRLAVVGLIVAGAACGSSPTVGPSPTSPSITPTPASSEQPPAAQLPAFPHLAGLWTGFLKITEGPHDAAGTTLPFTLRIAGDPQGYTGQFELSAAYSSPTGHINVGIAGRLREDGFAVLSGSTNVGSLSETAMEVPELIVKTDEVTGLAGTIRFGRWGRRWAERFSATILSASLQPSSAYPGGAIEGHWVGEALITACSGYCNVAVGYTREIELVLRQSGNMLSGSGAFGSLSCGGSCWLPLAGSANGHSIDSLSGRLSHQLYPDQLGDYVMTLSDFSATVDDLGRMQARFVYSAQSKAFNPRDYFGRLDVTSRLNMETVWLTRKR